MTLDNHAKGKTKTLFFRYKTLYFKWKKFKRGFQLILCISASAFTRVWPKRRGCNRRFKHFLFVINKSSTRPFILYNGLEISYTVFNLAG